MVKAQSSSPRQMEAALHVLEGVTAPSTTTSQPSHRRTHLKEQMEIQMYLSKLKELVPHMPKHRKVSKLEVIQHVIDYICELQTSLEQNHSSINLNRRRRSMSATEHRHHPASSAAGLASILAGAHRQPLGILSSIPNTLTEVNCPRKQT